MVRSTVVGLTPATIIESRRNHIVLSDDRALFETPARRSHMSHRTFKVVISTKAL